MNELKFNRTGKHILESECKHYAVTRNYSNGEIAYDAWYSDTAVTWKGLTRINQREIKLLLPSPKAGIEACEMHKARAEVAALKQGEKT